MTEDQLRAIFDEGKGEFTARVALTDASEEDVIRLLDTQIYFDRLSMPYPAERRGVLDRFVREGLLLDRAGAGGFDITNLGALLFAKDLRQFDLLARRAARVIEYAGSGKEDVSSDQPGTMGYIAGFQRFIDYSTPSCRPTRSSAAPFGTASRCTQRLRCVSCWQTRSFTKTSTRPGGSWWRSTRGE